MITKRYQECSLAEKLWRRRFYCLIPIYAVDLWHNNLDMNFSECWVLSTGIIQSKMNWLYTWNEMKEKLFKKI
jgi:hypothetical protein